uniref:Uncharacterized protein n=1 Tax=Thermorudis sp. TaxID=1969470 RepID=A0A7C2WI68_9BACT
MRFEHLYRLLAREPAEVGPGDRNPARDQVVAAGGRTQQGDRQDDCGQPHGYQGEPAPGGTPGRPARAAGDALAEAADARSRQPVTTMD